MSAGVYNFIIEQGTTFQRDFVYKDSNNVVVNLTNYTARMQIRPSKDSTVILVEATTANGKLSIAGAQGKISLVLMPSDTNLVGFDVGVYDLEIESAGGVVTRLLEGTVEVSKQVTR